MPRWEIAWKGLATVAVAAACIVGGILVLIGPHAYNDYFNAVLGIALIAIGVLAVGMGGLLILGIVIEAKRRQREMATHVVPRPGPLGPPPAWGMGDIGRVDGVVRVGDQPPGGGSVRMMTSAMIRWDAPVALGLLLVWTLVVTILLAPR